LRPNATGKCLRPNTVGKCLHPNTIDKCLRPNFNTGSVNYLLHLPRGEGRKPPRPYKALPLFICY